MQDGYFFANEITVNSKNNINIRCTLNYLLNQFVDCKSCTKYYSFYSLDEILNNYIKFLLVQSVIKIFFNYRRDIMQDGYFFATEMAAR